MEKKSECEIVQDLLLGYVDETLNKESKKLVEKHLIECESCRQRLEEIKQDMKLNQENQKKEIDYLKKIRRRLRIKSVLIAFAIIILVIIGIYVGKFATISNIMSKADKSAKSQNFYSESQQIIDNGKVFVHKVYYKDGKYKQTSEIYSDGGVEVLSTEYGEVGTDKRINISDKEKLVTIYSGNFTTIKNKEENIKWVRFTEDERHSLISNLGKAVIMSIGDGRYSDGKHCYILRNKFEQEQKWELWIDKETGLPIKEINRDGQISYIAGTDIVKEVKDIVQDYKYEFDIVTDDDVKVPDYSTYKVEYKTEE